MGYIKYPRIIIAGLGGDSGKTFVSCGIIRYFKDAGLKVGAFKKGPDYIDPAWLALSSGSIARNLDTFLMGNEIVKSNFFNNAIGNDINVIEGNRGLYDGFDSSGSYSTAELAKLLNIPVILVISVKKVTRTASAIVLGCRELDKELNLAGVIINQVGAGRQEKLIREAIEKDTGIPVIGAIPKLKEDNMPSRHLGLITPGEYDFAESAIVKAKEAIAKYVDTAKLIEIANSAYDVVVFQKQEVKISTEKKLKIGYFCDKIFSFYYQENLEALEESAELIKISSWEDKTMPDIDALYIGGGFPESNVNLLIENRSLMESLKAEIEKGLPVYAECGGLMYLADNMEIEGVNYKLSGILPINLKMNKRPLGHGYSEMLIDKENPFFEKDIMIKGHEFHYSGIADDKIPDNTCMEVKRGFGLLNKRDGIIYKNVFASYLHIHSAGCPEWSKGIIKNAKWYNENRVK
jgi:cobyrinic acid a,c-diamide synthase